MAAAGNASQLDGPLWLCVGAEYCFRKEAGYQRVFPQHIWGFVSSLDHTWE